MIKLTARQIEVLRKLGNGRALMLLDEGRHEFCDGGGRVGINVLKPLFDADLIVFEHSNQTVELTREGTRAARHGLGYEGPAGTPLNVQEYARLKVRVRRALRKKGYEETRSYRLGDDPDESGIMEWWTKDGLLLLVEFKPTPPIGECVTYRQDGKVDVLADVLEGQVKLYFTEFAYPDPYQDPKERPRHETSMTILYTADGDVAAVDDAVRFFRDRQRAIPDHFGKLWCIKVGVDHFGPISEKGHIQARHSFPFFEWKVDYPAPLEDYVGMFEARKLAALGGTEPQHDGETGKTTTKVTTGIEALDRVMESGIGLHIKLGQKAKKKEKK